MEWNYWKVVLRYGHVGHRREVRVARHIAAPSHFSSVDVMDLIKEMPGTKRRAMLSIVKIEMEEYLEGMRLEKENFFLQQLFDQRKAQ
ncbi:hypothetical protein [Planococcus soli]|uniref:hypothetical protein n=1 Tax=Planococcus soli TaxID=2666072 RepID=UPI00115CE370|nr:hypothetical protein [Planococcus soli]